MTDALYSTRLRWDSRRGVAKLHGRAIVLTAAPLLAGAMPHTVDYVPEIGIREIQSSAASGRRDMTPTEIDAADRLLAVLLAPQAHVSER